MREFISFLTSFLEDAFAPWISPNMFRRVGDETPLHEIRSMNRIELFTGSAPSGLVTML